MESLDPDPDPIPILFNPLIILLLLVEQTIRQGLWRPKIIAVICLWAMSAFLSFQLLKYFYIAFQKSFVSTKRQRNRGVTLQSCKVTTLQPYSSATLQHPQGAR